MVPTYGWRPFEPGRYRKLIAAAALTIVEAGALWADAPMWAIGVFAALVPFAVAAVPNEE